MSDDASALAAYLDGLFGPGGDEAHAPLPLDPLPAEIQQQTAAVAAARAPAAPASVSASRRRGRGIRYGEDSRTRAFYAYCEQAVRGGLLSEASEAALRSDVEALADGEREDEMLRRLESSLRGAMVEVVGATGRTPRGWWGDGSVGRVLSGEAFESRTPGLLPVRIGLMCSSDAVPEVIDVGIRATNLRLCVGKPPRQSQRRGESRGGGDIAGTSAVSSPSLRLRGARALWEPLRSASAATGSQLAAVLQALREAGAGTGSDEDGSAGCGNRLVVEASGSFSWIRELAPCVHSVALSVDHFWSGEGKTRLIERCCALDILQRMQPADGQWRDGQWRQGPADYVVNLGRTRRDGTPNPALAAWEEEAGLDAEFGRLKLFREALELRGVKLLDSFDSCFMRLYSAQSSIPPHRDAGAGRIRVVGNMGRARRVSFRLHLLTESEERDHEDAEQISWRLEHGWAYAITDAGAGREPLVASVDASEGAGVDLWDADAARHLLEFDAAGVMAWVCDIDRETSCDGCVSTILRRYEEAALAVALQTGITIDEAMQPPSLPVPFLYRPFEAGRRAGDSDSDDGRSSAQVAEGQTVDGSTRFLMLCCCSQCGRSHWLPAQEAPLPPAERAALAPGPKTSRTRLQLIYSRELHAPGCRHASGRGITLFPSLRRVGPGYRPAPQGGALERMQEAVIEVSESQPVAASLGLGSES